ncbi:hypothetical protein NEOLEDRAFT_393144 [Neolentinus lepideus HHB14362 ss-1]|uniref:Uncharacterized protein n=1 Tax=Neolentinus lepideus HHB14362 ss-1 TaxID=1314782 RepID=A0A165S7V1_9AGAM|nr:hypothetical protein NEOLEDRAFT_393144 [Neolentinus lepideus HHB14362 ss-1]
MVLPWALPWTSKVQISRNCLVRSWQAGLKVPKTFLLQVDFPRGARNIMHEVVREVWYTVSGVHDNHGRGEVGWLYI